MHPITFLLFLFTLILSTHSIGEEFQSYPQRISWTLINILRTDRLCYRDLFIEQTNATKNIMEGGYLLNDEMIFFEDVQPLYFSRLVSVSAMNHLEGNIYDCETPLSVTTCGCTVDCGVKDRCEALFYDGFCGTMMLGISFDAIQFISTQVCGTSILENCRLDGLDESMLRTRKNLLREDWHEIGIGHVLEEELSAYPFWEFVLGRLVQSSTYPIFGASHIISGDRITYYGVFYDMETPENLPTTFNVIIGEDETSLSMDAICTNSYAVITDNINTCTEYYFQAELGGVTWRFPETGKLFNYGDDCEEHYLAPVSESTEPNYSTCLIISSLSLIFVLIN